MSFNTEMVRALLTGQKTVTRRKMRPPPSDRPMYCYAASHNRDIGRWHDKFSQRWTPPCHTGDILWVQETWSPYDSNHVIDGIKYAYRADATAESERIRKAYGYKWRSSVQMPRDAARIFLRVISVRVERLRDITPEQARAEGCDGRCDCPSSGADGNLSCVTRDFSVEKFIAVWDSTLKPADRPVYGWNANPWVWVIEFERINNENRVN